MALSTKVGTLMVDMALNSAAFQSQTTKTMDSIERSSKRTASSLGVATSAAKGFIAAFSVQQISAVTVQALKWAGSIQDTATALGATTAELQEYRYAASQSGVAVDDMDEGLRKLNATMGSAMAGSKAQSGLFKALGIDLQDATGKARPLGDVMDDVAKRMAGIENPATRAAVAGKLFGEELGPKLLPLLTKGKEGVDKLRESARELGVVLSSREISNADEAARKMGALHSVLQTKIASTVAENAASITKLATSVTELAIAGIRLASVDPERTKGVMAAMGGAYAGSKVGGGPGAVVGAMAGYIAGNDDTKAGIKSFYNEGGGGLSGAWSVATSGWPFGESVEERGKKVNFLNKLWGGPGAVNTGGATKSATGGFDTGALEKLLAGGGGGKKAKKEKTGPTLQEQFDSLSRTLAPDQAALDDMQAALALISQAERQGLKTKVAFGELRASAVDQFLDKVGYAAEGVSDGLKLTDAPLTRMKVNLDEVNRVGQQLDDTWEKNQRFAEQFSAAMSSAFEDAIFSGKSLLDIVGGLAEDILRMILRMQVLQPMAENIAKSMSGAQTFGSSDGAGVVSSVMAGLGAIFGFADGGRPPLGRVSIVGERGPELFVPDTAGTILPNEVLSAGGSDGGTVINVDARWASDPQAVGRAVLQASVGISGVVTDRKIAGSQRPKLGMVLG